MNENKFSQLDDFIVHLREFIGLVGAALGSTSLVLVTPLLGIAPPWPGPIIPITAIGQLIVLLFTFHLLSGASKHRVSSIMKGSLLALVVSFPIYLFLFSILVFEMPNGDGGIRGIYCSRDALVLYLDNCPLLTSNQIARGNFDSERLWTIPGISISRLALLFFWINSFISLVYILSSFAVFHRSRSAKNG